VRLSNERAALVKDGNDMMNYVNVFGTKRLSVFKNIAQSTT